MGGDPQSCPARRPSPSGRLLSRSVTGLDRVLELAAFVELIEELREMSTNALLRKRLTLP